MLVMLHVHSYAANLQATQVFREERRMDFNAGDVTPVYAILYNFLERY